MTEECLAKCTVFVCNIIPSCYKRSRYNQPMLISFASIEFIIAIAQIVLFGLYFAHGRRNQQTRQHLKIFIVSFLALAARSIWYIMTQYYYRANLPVIAEQVLNGISLTCLYLQQSFYVQTWLRVIIILSHMHGEKFVKIFFPVIDSIVVCVFCIIMIIRIAHGNEDGQDQSYYQSFCLFTAGMNVVVGIGFIITGTLIFLKLKQYYSFCSKAVQSFVLVAVIFLIITVMRFTTLIWKEATGDFMPQNQFGIMAYFVPDFVSTFVINLMQVTIYWSQIRQKKKRYLGMQEQYEEIDGRTVQTVL
ncbi:Conserved_hypothetical protein [Hexamita inflata]|uniref:Uncharacterized protein n=1 Tax=Hexamita inflata TaxID=28002 RepID=A0AA86PMP4_9EUKA|nr:Conserved hypothetical protein [Hexamita inflata]